MIRRCIRTTIGCVAFLIFSIFNSSAQQFPETLWVPVTYYDFHADSTNPNFEESPDAVTGYTGQATKGMIKPTLSTDRKPLLLANLMFNNYVEQWFRPSNSTGAQYTYNPTTRSWKWSSLLPYSGRANEFVGAGFVATNPMANVVIYDSLPFILSDPNTGTYVYNNQNFFPLDGRGFGTEPASYPAYNWTNSGHNFSFTMEIHQKFTYQPNLMFSFTGDDDVWAFIDEKLVMDIGGIHSALTDSINLSTLGLVPGRQYNFDFFYAERHVTASTIKITTNILSPGRLLIKFIGDSVLTAGFAEPILEAIVLDTSGQPVPHAIDAVKWSIEDKKPGDQLINTSGDTASLYATLAWRTMRIRATYIAPETGLPLTTTAIIFVRPGPPSQVSIEALNGDTTKINMNNKVPLDTIPMLFSQDTAFAYAVYRDKFDNYAGLANGASWTSSDITQVTVGTRPLLAWTGIIQRGIFKSNSSAIIPIMAGQTGLTSDTVIVAVRNTIQTLPPIVNPPGGNFSDSLIISMSPQTPNSLIMYCLDYPGTANPPYNDAAWLPYNGPIQVSKMGKSVLRAYAYVNQEGYLPSVVVTYEFTRVPANSWPPVAVPPGGDYYGTISDIKLTANPQSKGAVTIYYCLTCSVSDPPPGDPSWIPYDGRTFTFSDTLPIVLKMYGVNYEGTPSPVVSETYRNKDWYGPLVKDAIYYLGNLPGDRGPRRADTLRIIFNEPVQCSDLTAFDKIFWYNDKDTLITADTVFNMAYGKDQCVSGTKVNEYTIILPANGKIMPIADKIGAIPDKLHDQYRNPTRSLVQIPIRWGRDYDWTAVLSPNPWDPGRTDKGNINPITGLVYIDANNVPPPPISMAIQIETVKELDLLNSTVTIYDPLGNVVQSKIRPYKSKANPNGRYIFFWDGRNMYKRIVGTGTYVAIITIKQFGDTGYKSKRLKIGIRR